MLRKQSKSLLLYSIIFFCAFTSLFSANIFATEVPVISDIREEAQLASDKNLPILILFSSEYCPYCDLVKRDFLVPMIISGDYQNQVIIREVNIDEGSSLIDFNGQAIDNDSFAYRYNISMFPTMIMLNHKGETISHRILGVNTPEMFGGRIDAMINLANRELNQKLSKK